MACKTPVLLTDKVNIWREVQMSGGGLVGPDTSEGIESLLRSWLSLSDDGKSAMRAGARAGFERHFRIEAAARDLIAILLSISPRGLHEAA
ncbi:hypothetical protein [Neorhizobium galegae]|uniref:hypothetical protein n=1 Tax=Neorhizobium galegae TaxID=399 RepID=UPI000620F19C|nr:hypothetical protein [Neorhizobium galegae]CDZ47719.1 Hypothetical protein NGAL_HAMBI2427_23030 [Neorhizobium galegae bv. orientalis]